MLKVKSGAKAKARFLKPPDKGEVPLAALEDEVEQPTKHTKRHASVYDAVAGVASVSTASTL